MALVLADRVQEYSTTTGTGTLTLSGAYAGFQTFAAGIGNGNTCYYTITSDTNQWEVGIGTVGTGTLARTTLLSSSTGSTIDFVGTLTAFVTLPAEQAVVQNAAGVVTGYPITVTDNVFTLQDNLDPTKQAQFQLSVIGTGATRTFTLQNQDGTLAALNIAQNWTSAQTFTATTNILGSGVGTTTSSVGSGATTTGNTKTVNVGTGGLSGSTTNITVGSANGSTTTMLGSTVIGGLSGNQSLQVNNVASAVNYAQIVGAVTGNGPIISAQGADTNIGVAILGKGNGGISIGGSGGTFPSLLVSSPAATVNAFQIFGNSAGGGVALNAIGADTNIGMQISSKGTGSVNIFNNGVESFRFGNVNGSDFTNYYNTTGSLNYTAAGGSANTSFYFGAKGTGSIQLASGGGTQAIVSNTASAVNYLQVTGAATGAAPTISAQGSDANINLKLTPKGTGVLQFGTYTADVLSPTGYITITDAAGTSRRLLVG
jgi:hypothetical protein